MSETEDQHKKHDQAVEDSFPASDPISHPNITGPRASDPARKDHLEPTDLSVAAADDDHDPDESDTGSDDPQDVVPEEGHHHVSDNDVTNETMPVEATNPKGRAGDSRSESEVPVRPGPLGRV